MDKKEVAAILEEIALLLEVSGENPFKVRAYEAGARVVLTYPGELDQAVRNGALAQVKGIGKSLAGVIAELVQTGQAALHQELKGKVPPGLLQMMEVPGLGPKKAKALYDELHIASLGELEYACQENRLAGLPGFGAKTQEKIKAGLEGLRRYAGLFRLGDLLPAADSLLKELRRLPELLRVELGGELRRRCEVAPSIEMVAAANRPEEALAALARVPGLSEFKVEGPGRGAAVLPQGVRLQVTLAPPENFGAAWLTSTGSPEHLQGLEARAREEGLQLTESGLTEGPTILPGREEGEIYARLGLPEIPPELREGRGEIEAGLKGGLPRLVTESEVKGCFHVHSFYSDGVNSPEELVVAAKSRGWNFLGLSDHSQSAYYAGGLKPPDLMRQKEELSQVRARHPEVTLFWGIESDILADGALDYPDETLKEFDFVIASVHSQFHLPREAMTQRLLAALANPYCTMLGHSSGRLLLAREPYEFDLEAILEFAGAHQVIMELNASPYRLDLDWRWLKRAKELGIIISINPDAHSLEGLDDVSYGVMAARKGWLEPKDVLNTYAPAEVAGLLRRRRG